MFVEMILALFVAAIVGGLIVHISNRRIIKRFKLNNFELVSKLGRERNRVDDLGGKLTEMRSAERKRLKQLREASKKGTAARQAAAARRREEKAAATGAMLSSVGMKSARKSK